MAVGKKLTQEDFVSRAATKHNNKYDYSEAVYINSHTKVVIVCPSHGKFEQLPYSHLKGEGCAACSGKQRTSQEDFIRRAKQAIGDQYDFSRAVYKNLSTPVVVSCPIHGDFTKPPKLILQQNRGCPACGQERYKEKVKNTTLTTQQFIDRAAVVHESKYSYDHVVYINSGTKVQIRCNIHGNFLQTPTNHLSGQGCPKCGDIRSGGCGGYTDQLFDADPDKKEHPAILYLMEVSRDKERFVKVGITTKTIKERFDRVEYKGMTFTPICIKYMSLYEAFCVERKIIESLKGSRFFSNTKFSGYTECFKVSAKDAILNILNE